MAPAAPVPHVCRPRPARSRLGRCVEQMTAAVMLPLVLAATAATLLASRLAMAVGTRVRRDVRSGSGDQLRVLASQLFLVAQTERGRTDTPIEASSLAEWEAEFGGLTPYGYGTHQLAAYFAEGGTRVWTVRKVGSAATKGDLTLKDTDGTPADTLKVEAISAGAWSQDLEVSVAAGSVADTVTVTLWLHRGTARERKEVYRNAATVAELAGAINARSRWATATDLGSATAYPNRLPATVSPTALSAGDDDLSSLNAAAMVGALDLFPAELGPGVVIVPGYHGDDIGQAMAAHCLATGRDGLLHGDPDDTLADARSSALALVDTPGGECLGWVHPWPTIADPDGLGDIPIPPVGVLAGLRARAVQTEGPHRLPAGDDYQSTIVTGLTEVLTAEEIDQANADHVIPLVRVGVGAAQRFEPYGYRSLSDDEENFFHLAAHTVLASLAWDIQQACAGFPFRPIDARRKLETGLESAAAAVCQRYVDRGSLYPRIVDGQEVDPGYSVAVATYPAEKRAEVVVAARATEAAELVDLTVIKVPLASAV